MISITYNVKHTEHGVTVTKSVYNHFGHFRDMKKHFRNGYAAAIITADQWIHDDIDVYRENSKINDIEMPEINVVGHKLYNRRPKFNELTALLRKMLAYVESHTDDVAKQLCEETYKLMNIHKKDDP